jgi:hypothetical protein
MGQNTFSFGTGAHSTAHQTQGRRNTMKKRARWTLLLLAGALAYFATEKVGMAGCVAECWDNGFGNICCTNEYCIDYCI